MTDGPGTQLLKIGDFAKLANTNLRTLRYYEELGLLAPARRSQGGFRYYRETDVNRFRMVQTMQELGLSLERIGELITTRNGGDDRHAFLDRVREALAEQDRLFAERQAAIAAKRGRLAEAMAKLSECGECRMRPGPENNFCEPCEMSGQPLPEDLSALF